MSLTELYAVHVIVELININIKEFRVKDGIS